jgi:type IV pilus assembly protein PilM
MAQLVVGLDIGTSAVRAAELDISHSRPVLLTYGQVGLPPGSLVDGEIRDSSAVSNAIKKLWENGQFSSSSVIVGIAGLRAITREIDLPFVPDNEVDSAVRFQSEEVIPFPPDQTILSSQILADYTSPEGDKMRRILVAAAHVDLVNGVIAAVENAGLTVDGVDLISSALVRAVGGHEESDQPEAIVSVGAGLTVVVVHQNGRPQFVRTIGSGGNATTAAVSAALDIPMPDAEGVKRRIVDGGAQMQAADRAAQASMNELVGEIRNSIQYFASLPGRLPVSRVLVTGGGSALHGLIPLLEAQVRLPVVWGWARPPGYFEARPHHRTGRRSQPGAFHADRAGPLRAGQVHQEVQPPASRGGGSGPTEADPAAHTGRMCRRAGSAGGLWGVEVPAGPQRPEPGQFDPVEHRRPQRPGAEVRRGCSGQ